LTNPATRFGLLLLLVLFMAVGVGFFLYQQEQRLASSIWPDYTLDAVQSIEVTTHKERYTIVREASGWVVRLEGGEADALPVPADPARIEALLAAIAHSRPNQMLRQSLVLKPLRRALQMPLSRCSSSLSVPMTPRPG